MIYDIDGTQLNAVYDAEGQNVSQVYDVEGNQLFSSADIVVMTYNVQWFTGINNNQSMQESILETYSPDVIGFQEFQKATESEVPALATTLLSGTYQVEMGNYGNKNALASKHTMTNFTTIEHTQQAQDGQSYSTAHITINGKDILLVVSHVATSSFESKKLDQIEEIFNAVENVEYFIIMADFNTTCKSVNDTEYTTIMKQFVDAGYNCANCTEQHGFNDTWTDGNSVSGTWYPCDNIITSDNIDMNTVIIDTTKIDVAALNGKTIDHLPIITYLTVT